MSDDRTTGIERAINWAEDIHNTYRMARAGLYEAMRQALATGATCRQLGDRLGVNASTVHRWAKRAGA